MTANPFAKPASATGIQWEDLKGRLLLIKPRSYEEGITTSVGEKDAIRADVHVLDGDDESDVYIDTLVFPRVLISQLRSNIGAQVLGRLEQGVAKKGQNPPWKLAEATDEDVKVGTAYLASGFAKPADTDKPPF